MNFWNDPLKVAADWLAGVFTGWGMLSVGANVLVAFLGILLLITILMVIDIFLVWIERKVVARFQDRIGPNRLGPFGLIQPFADIIKLMIKEDTTPDGADKVVVRLGRRNANMACLLPRWGGRPGRKRPHRPESGRRLLGGNHRPGPGHLVDR